MRSVQRRKRIVSRITYTWKGVPGSCFLGERARVQPLASDDATLCSVFFLSPSIWIPFGIIRINSPRLIMSIPMISRGVFRLFSFFFFFLSLYAPRPYYFVNKRKREKNYSASFFLLLFRETSGVVFVSFFFALCLKILRRARR